MWKSTVRKKAVAPPRRGWGVVGLAAVPLLAVAAGLGAFGGAAGSLTTFLRGVFVALALLSAVIAARGVAVWRQRGR